MAGNQGGVTGAGGNQGAGDPGAGQGAGGTGTGGNQGAGGGQGSGGTPPAWYSQYPGDLPAYLEQKGFKDPTALAESYRNLEKLRGVPEERLLQLPEKSDDPAWDKIHAKLGRPEKPEGYEFKPLEGTNPEFLGWLSSIFHEAGVSKKAGEQIVAKWHERAAAGLADHKAKTEAAVTEQVSKLQQTWGAAFAQNRDQVAAFSEAIGLDDDTAKMLGQTMGVDKLNTFLHGIITKFGIKLGEQQFQGGGGNNGFGVLSPEAARERITALRNDPGFAAKYTSGDVDARAEMDRLHRWASGVK